MAARLGAPCRQHGSGGGGRLKGMRVRDRAAIGSTASPPHSLSSTRASERNRRAARERETSSAGSLVRDAGY